MSVDFVDHADLASMWRQISILFTRMCSTQAIIISRAPLNITQLCICIGMSLSIHMCNMHDVQAAGSD